MSNSPSTGNCPVCGMTNVNSLIATTYRGIEYFFCSSQCKNRFESHPQLFVGDPQHGISEKQKGRAELKERRIVLNDQLNEGDRALLRKAIADLMGVIGVEVNSTEIRVKYDLMQVSLTDIENTVIEVIGNLRTNLTDKIKRSIIHYTEECELENLSHLTKE